MKYRLTFRIEESYKNRKKNSRRKEVVYVTKNKNCGYKNNKNLCNVL